MRLAIATGTLGVLVAVACSSGGSGGTAATSSGFGQQYCGLIAPCCAAAGLSTDGTLCNAFAQEAATKGTYDAAAGQDCITGMQAEQGTDALCASLGNDVPACARVFGASGGTVQPGQPCTDDANCAVAPGGGATCFTTDTFVDGGTTQSRTCIQTTAGKAGDSPCIGTVEASVTIYSWSGDGPPPSQAVLCSLADGVTCSATTQACTALAAVGAACTTTTDCVAAAYCDFTGSGGTCTARLDDGATCDAAPQGCQTTSFCDPASHTCTPYTAPGAACTTDQECQYGCVNSSCAHGTSNFGLALICG